MELPDRHACGVPVRCAMRVQNEDVRWPFAIALLTSGEDSDRLGPGNDFRLIGRARRSKSVSRICQRTGRSAEVRFASMQIAELLNRRADLSTSVVHLTKATVDTPAKGNLLYIVYSQTIKAGRSIGWFQTPQWALAKLRSTWSDSGVDSKGRRSHSVLLMIAS